LLLFFLICVVAFSSLYFHCVYLVQNHFLFTTTQMDRPKTSREMKFRSVVESQR